MCELLGLSFAAPVSADFSIREFRLRSEENADGWGLAWYPDRSAAIVKEPLKWGASPYTSFLETYTGLRSRLYVAHVRHRTTGGEATHADTHPFARELGGRDYCFAHNGTLEGAFWQLPLGRYRPVGRTDSEFLFCYLLEEIAKRSAGLAGPDGWSWFQETLRSLNQWGKMNCLLADGERLYCYHDRNGYKGLHFSPVAERPRETGKLEDTGFRVDLTGSTAARGHAIATCALNASTWHRFAPGELIVFEGDAIRFGGREQPLSASSAASPGTSLAREGAS